MIGIVAIGVQQSTRLAENLGFGEAGHLLEGRIDDDVLVAGVGHRHRFLHGLDHLTGDAIAALRVAHLADVAEGARQPRRPALGVAGDGGAAQLQPTRATLVDQSELHFQQAILTGQMPCQRALKLAAVVAVQTLAQLGCGHRALDHQPLLAVHRRPNHQITRQIVIPIAIRGRAECQFQALIAFLQCGLRGIECASVISIAQHQQRGKHQKQQVQPAVHRIIRRRRQARHGQPDADQRDQAQCGSGGRDQSHE